MVIFDAVSLSLPICKLLSSINKIEIYRLRYLLFLLVNSIRIDPNFPLKNLNDIKNEQVDNFDEYFLEHLKKNWPTPSYVL